ncbi:MAG: hypothetical protein GXO11_08050 [Epsilonproteobacteria bacterium]|nr:hypothetical protein [Campylobacterota bacterium]
MVYISSQNKEISLENLMRLYAAAYIEVGGEQAEMSLEWMDANADKVNLIEYVLVFDYTPRGSEERIKTILSFQTKEELLNEMQRVVDFINANNNS